jgi:ABC-2 type transport system permease protein
MNASSSAVAPRRTISQGWLFQKIRWLILRNAGTQLFGNSRVRFISMILSCLIIWGAIFAGAYWGFGIVAENNVFHASNVMTLVFDTMFFTLGAMLVFSTGLIVYASLFTGAETRFLLTTPARADQIFAVKFQGAVAFSSWAFMILGTPILIAYGITFGVPWHFYALLPVYFLGFTLLPGTLGAVICLLVVNYFPQKRRQALMLILAVSVLAAGYFVYQAVQKAGDATRNRESLKSLFDMFALANSKFSPSHWMSRGLLASARGDAEGALFSMALLWSNGLFLYVIGTYLAKLLYRRGYNRMSEGGFGRRKYRGALLDKIMNFLVGYLHRNTRLLIVKDFRTFRREPAQVGQLGIFAALMILGVLNIRQFLGVDVPLRDRAAVSRLNVFATGLLTCAYLARFVYPLISLEGRKFWILGLLPLKREQLLWGKFAFAVTMTTVIGTLLVGSSDLFLGMPWTAIVVHLFAVVTLALGLSGLCVGMSAWMPNFRESDPSKIVVGFGGTMFTIISLCYLIIMMLVIAAPFHIALFYQGITGDHEMPWWVFIGIPFGVVIALLAVWFPMKIGGRTLARMEF